MKGYTFKLQSSLNVAPALLALADAVKLPRITKSPTASAGDATDKPWKLIRSKHLELGSKDRCLLWRT